MSECVVRMEMPECCDDCPMEYDGFMCRAIHKRFYPQKDGRYLDPLIDTSKERLPDCPIICSLPEGHGTLIDLETAAEGLSERFNSCHMTCGAVMQFLDGLPTIVPAERSEKDGK